MSALWLGAAPLAALAIAFLVRPLLGQAQRSTLLAFALGALVLVVTGVVLWGRTAALAPDSAGGPGELARLAEQAPENAQRWLDLGEAYAQGQQYELARRAFQRADRLTGGHSVQALAGIGEALVLGSEPNPQVIAQADHALDQALALDPHSAKALFFSALNAYRDNRYALARTRFAAILDTTPAPPPGVRAALLKQIADLDQKLHPAADAATAIEVHVRLAAPLAARVPPGAQLFVFARAGTGGPPLAARRLGPELPQTLTLSSRDALIPSNALGAGQHVELSARLTQAGDPTGHSGDLEGTVAAIAGQRGPAELLIDRVRP